MPTSAARMAFSAKRFFSIGPVHSIACFPSPVRDRGLCRRFGGVWMKLGEKSRGDVAGNGWLAAEVLLQRCNQRWLTSDQ